ncbi:MAG: type II secretion system protein [Verrucomicrobiaceae bacterium]|nr:type II secretion system protein [Verrucomicrobiaceae bacterium]
MPLLFRILSQAGAIEKALKKYLAKTKAFWSNSRGLPSIERTSDPNTTHTHTIPMKTKTNRGFTLIELLVVITIIAILASLAVPAFNAVQRQGNQMKAVSNCKQIILSMKQFAGRNNSQYPDTVTNPQTGGMAQTANDAFRLMIQEQIITDERIFGCPAGYNPDGNIGQPPQYGMALLQNENHWAMTQGLTDTSPGNMPLVFENPAAVGWPPQWNANFAGQLRPGRTWPGGQVIIGRNDGGAEVVDLNGKQGMVGPKQMAGGLDMFTQATPGQMQNILNAQIQGGPGMGGTGGVDPTSTLGSPLGAPLGSPLGAPLGSPIGGAPGQVPGALPPGPIPGAPGAPGGLPPSPLGN